jgi:hypothetical protein
MDSQNPGKENKNLDSIRHFKGTWKEFEDFWKSKGARMSPYEEWEQEYPKKKKMVNKDPINMYKTFDDESEVVEESHSDFLTFNKFVNEENMVAMAGSQQDYPPIQKPFVYKTKKRKGSNEDDSEDDTEEVANVNTTGIGTS